MSTRIAITLTVCLFFLTSSQIRADVYSDLINSQTPILYYRLGEVAGPTATNLGSLGAAGDGTYGSAVGYSGTSLIPSGTDSSVTFSADINSRVVRTAFGLPTSTVSVSFWVNGQDTGLSHFFGYGAGSSANEFTFGSDSGGFRTIVNGSIQDFDTVDVLDGTSHHIGISWTSSTGSLLVYVDGSPEASRTVTAGTPLQTGGVLALGQDLDNLTPPNYGFNASQALVGRLDEFAIFDRVLTPAEFNSQFIAGVPEPSSVVLIGLVGLAMISRRRR